MVWSGDIVIDPFLFHEVTSQKCILGHDLGFMHRCFKVFDKLQRVYIMSFTYQ